MSKINDKATELFIVLQTIELPLTLEKINEAFKLFINDIKQFVNENKIKNFDWNNENTIDNVPENNAILDKCYCSLQSFRGYILNIKFKVNPVYIIEGLSLEIKKLYKDKNLDWYEGLMNITDITIEELRCIHDEPENFWKQKDNKFTAKYTTTTRMKCPDCNLELYVNSYYKSHKGSKKCANAFIPKPPKKNGTDKIKCCELCPKVDYYGHLSRLKKHRSICELYKKYLSSLAMDGNLQEIVKAIGDMVEENVIIRKLDI